MDLIIKEVDKNNKCNICESEIDNDIIIEKALICKNCHKGITNITVDDFNYDFYKNKIKNWILKKYKLDKR